MVLEHLLKHPVTLGFGGGVCFLFRTISIDFGFNTCMNLGNLEICRPGTPFITWSNSVLELCYSVSKDTILQTGLSYKEVYFDSQP